MTASPATILVNVSGHFYEYTLKGEVKETDGQDVPDAEMLKKVSVLFEIMSPCQKSHAAFSNLVELI